MKKQRVLRKGKKKVEGEGDKNVIIFFFFFFFFDCQRKQQVEKTSKLRKNIILIQEHCTCPNEDQNRFFFQVYSEISHLHTHTPTPRNALKDKKMKKGFGMVGNEFFFFFFFFFFC